MKTIVVSGGQSRTGKTTLAKALAALLPHGVCVKIGHGQKRTGKMESLYPLGTPFLEIARIHCAAHYLILESNGILKEMTPDLAIYLDSESPKPSSAWAREKADILRGQRITPERVTEYAQRLDVDDRCMRKIAWLAGARPSETTAIILSGGKSSRMGTRKATLLFHGLTAVEAIAQRLQPHFDDLILSVSHEDRTQYGELRTVRDRVPDQGPLRAIASSLQQSRTAINFVVACDIPRLNWGLIYELLMWSEEYDIVVPSFQVGHREPLYGIYRRTVGEAAEEILCQGKRRVAALLDRCSFREILVEDGTWYANLNTPEEYREFLERDSERDIAFARSRNPKDQQI